MLCQELTKQLQSQLDSIAFINICIDRPDYSFVSKHQLFDENFSLCTVKPLRCTMYLDKDDILLFHKGCFSFRVTDILSHTSLRLPVFKSSDEFIDFYETIPKEYNNANIQWFAHSTLLSVGRKYNNVDFDSLALYCLTSRPVYVEYLDYSKSRDEQVEQIAAYQKERLSCIQNIIRSSDYTCLLNEAVELGWYSVSEETRRVFSEINPECMQFRADDNSRTLFDPNKDNCYDFSFVEKKTMEEIHTERLLADWSTRYISYHGRNATSLACEVYAQCVD